MMMNNQSAGRVPSLLGGDSCGSAPELCIRNADSQSWQTGAGKFSKIPQLIQQLEIISNTLKIIHQIISNNLQIIQKKSHIT